MISSSDNVEASPIRQAFTRIGHRMYLESRHLAANTVNQQLAAVRRLAHEAADAGLSPELAAADGDKSSLWDGKGWITQVFAQLVSGAIASRECYMLCL